MISAEPNTTADPGDCGRHADDVVRRVFTEMRVGRRVLRVRRVPAIEAFRKVFEGAELADLIGTGNDLVAATDSLKDLDRGEPERDPAELPEIETPDEVSRVAEEIRETDAAIGTQVTRTAEQVSALADRLEELLAAEDDEDDGEEEDEEAEAPDFEDDPAEHLRHQIEKTQKQIGDIAVTREAEQAQAAGQQFLRNITAAEAEFTKEHPDYREALQHLKQQKLAAYAEAGVTGDQAAAALQNEIVGFTGAALRAGRNPVETIYAIARQAGGQSGKAKGKAEALTAEKVLELDGKDFDKAFDKLQRAGELG